MKRGMRISTLFAVIAAVLLFAAGGAWAFSQPDGLCPADQELIGECDITAGGWVVEIVPGEPGTAYEGQFPVPTTNGNRFKYMITGPGTGKSSATQANLLVPSPLVCGVDNQIEVLWGDSSVSLIWYDPTTGFSSYDNAHQVISFNSLKIDPSNHGNITVYTNTQSAAKNSFLLKVGNSPEFGVVLTPDCQGGMVAATTSRTFQLDPKNPNAFIKVAFRADGTLLRAVGVIDGVETPLTGRDIKEFTLNGLQITYAPSDTVIKSGDHSCYWYSYNYKLYGPVAVNPDTVSSCLNK